MSTENKQLDAQHETINVGKKLKYENQYGDYIDLAATSMKKKFEYDWTAQDTLAFGDYAKTWEEYKDVFESDVTSRNALGPALHSNLGLVAMAYASLPIQNLASVQPIGDEAGTVFFRKGVAAQARGDIAAGEQLIGAYGGINKNIGSFTSETQVKSLNVINSSGNPGAGPYTTTLAPELKPGGLNLSVGGGKIKGVDNGEGNILGVGIDAAASTVDYNTGAVSITFIAGVLTSKGVTVSDKVDITYRVSTVESNTIPTMKWILASKVVQADYYVLQSQYSTMSEMVLKKRFGNDLADDISADLVSQITSSVMNQAIAKLRQSAIRNEVATGNALTWKFFANDGVSEADHRRTFDDKLIDATGEMYKIAGKGDVSTLVVGTRGKQILKTAGMRMIKSAVSGPHLCGMYDSVPVYYAPNTILAENEILVIYRGANWYEAPLAYAPFLPVTTVSGKSVNNVLTNADGAFHSAALESVMDGFVIRITIDMTPNP